MSDRIEGLGTVAAVDAAPIDESRFMSPNTKHRSAHGFFEFSTTGGVPALTIRPVYRRSIGGAEGEGLDYEDPSQDKSYAANGNYCAEFRAIPGFRLTFKVTVLTGTNAKVIISGQYHALPAVGV